jgi:hypothetical protein
MRKEYIAVLLFVPLFFLQILCSAETLPYPSIPCLNADEYDNNPDSLTPIVADPIKPVPDNFQCRLGIYKDTLILWAETDTPLSSKPVSSSPLKTDSFDVMIDAANNLRCHYVFSIDFSGNAKTSIRFADGHLAELPVKVSVSSEEKENRVAVTVGIPLDELQMLPGTGDCWGVEYQRHMLDKEGKSVTYNSIAVSGRPLGGAGRGAGWFITPRHFQKFVLGDSPAGVSLTRGSLAREEVHSENRFTWTYLKPPDSGKAELEIKWYDKERQQEDVVQRCVFEYRAGEPAVVNATYHCPLNEGMITFSVRNGKAEILYASSYPVIGNTPSVLDSRTGEFTEEQFEIAKDPRLDGDAILTWPHALHQEFMVSTNAIPVGYEYIYEKWLQYLKDTNQVVVLVHPGFWGRNEFEIHAPAFAKHNLKCALMPTAVKARESVPYQQDHLLFLPDPKLRQAYLDSMVEALKEYPEVIKYIYLGDELSEILIKSSRYLYLNKREEYPYIEKVDEDIKKRFGSGKYGLPSRYTDAKGDISERLQWRAFHRWIADFIENFSKEVIARAREIKPDIMFISEDPPFGNRARYFETWKGLYDITTHQAFNAHQVTFDIKVLKDLSGTPHMWPCPHMESVAAAYSPNQVQDLLSRFFMAGATGLMTWPIAARDAMVRPDIIDSPGTTRMMLDFGRMMSEGIRVKHNNPQVAVFYSNDSFCAGGYPGTNELHPAFDGLGFELGADFKFIGDIGIERGHDNLNDYKVLIVPRAEICRRNVTKKILQAVEEGLILIVHRYNSFSIDIDGTGTDELASRLRGGAEMIPADDVFRKPNTIWLNNKSALFKDIPVSPYGVNALTYTGTPFTFKNLPQESEIIATYNDRKTPAAIMVPVGKGKVIWTGVASTLIYSRDYPTFYKPVFERMNISVNQPGWRVTLPLKFRREPMDGIYYTGNYYSLEFQIPQTGRNAYLPGFYRYSLPPDGLAGWSRDIKSGDINNAGQISFNSGSLTDRGRYTRGGVKYRSTEEFHIDFDLAARLPLKQVNLYLSGCIPAMELMGSKDGKEYKLITSTSGEKEITGVKKYSLTTGDLKEDVRYVRISFAERPQGKELTIAEIDIIGKNN